MKSMTIKITLIAFVTLGVISCKNNEKNSEAILDEAAVASNMAAEYAVDTAASRIKWEGYKPTATHHGTIQLSSGILSAHNGQVEAGNLVIDMNTIDDEDLEGDDKAALEAHLKGTTKGKEGDFFNVNEYPNAKFELTRTEGNIVKGNLTIKDKTNAIEFPAAITIDGDQLTIKSEPFKLDRTKWDVNYGSKSVFPNLGNKFISDDMQIEISVVANKM